METETPKHDICDRSFDFAVRIVKLCETLNSASSVSRTLSDQLLRSGTSIGANIEEAQGGQSKADFISKMSIALKEARETQYWLRLLIASNLVPEQKLLPLKQEATELVAILTTIVKNSRGHA
jgi:four helix bundle protein